jgi:hypothetical protein
MIVMIRALLAIVCLLLVNEAVAQDSEFEMALPEPGAGEQVLGGVPVDVSEWPATLVFTSTVGLCTSTVIGKRVVITAAHCINDGVKGRIKIGDQTTNVTCHHHPNYSADYRMDISLCEATDADIVLTRGSKKFETINAATKPANGTSIRLLGYGCTVSKGDNPRKILYGGHAPLTRTDGAYLVTVGSNAVCFGDSGGGAYVEAPTRKLVGINSRGDIISRSLLSSLADPSIKAFLQSWVDRGLQICGLSADETNCR